MNIEWEDGFSISIKHESGTMILTANRKGLLSLAKQLTVLSSEVPGTHIHYDTFNSLEDGSDELIIELTAD